MLIGRKIVPTICTGVGFSFFFFVFRAKSGTTNNHRNESSDIAHSINFSCDSNNMIQTFISILSEKSELNFAA